MQQEEQASTAVARVEQHPAALLLDDEQIRLTYRIAESLYRSGAWGQLKNAEAAFAKIVIGRDLGLSPAQAMQGIHIVEGGVQMHYAQIGQFIRARDGYDYKAGWLKTESLGDWVAAQDRAPTEQEAAGIVEGATVVVAVYHADEEPTDVRPIVGAFVEFYVDDERRGVSRFTEEDAQAAGLIKPDKPKAAWNTSRRNMLLARAMSNGAKWFVPEVFGGMPVYSMGEIPASEQKSLTAPAGADGGDEGSGIELGPKVEEIIERATALGHRGLSNRAQIELACGNRAQSVVNDWVVRARAELDRFEAERAAATPGGVVADVEPQEQAVEEEVDAEPVAAAEDVPTPEPSTSSPPVDAVVSTGDEDPEVVLLRDRLRRLNEMSEDPAAAPDDLDQLLAEIDVVEGKLRAKGVEPNLGEIDANSDGEE